MSKEIRSIKIKQYFDSDPDTSFLGEYSNKRAKFSFDRQFLGDMNRNEYRYFNPYPNPLTGKTQKEKKELYQWAKQNYERMESLNNQNWFFFGLVVEAEIIINGVIQNISSGGLWGIESDSDRSYLQEIIKDEITDLKDQLKEIGFFDEDIEDIEIEYNEDKFY